MIALRSKIERLECPSKCAIDWVAARPTVAAAVLLALALVSYLPGLVGLPPVDRTEIVYAESSRAMLERGDYLDAQFQGERAAFRPIGIYWLQIASGKLFGASAWDAIATYRFPSLLGGVLAVLAVWWFLRPVLGARGSLIAAGLYAVTPIVALQAELSIPEGPLLLALALAQVTLLRIYCASDGDRTFGLALLFWAAQGFGILINALAVPILSLSTVIALFVFDRRLVWLMRLRPLLGVPLMLLIAAPWVLVRAHLDGGAPFSTLTWSEFLRALGGAQDMKWKAAPLTFTLALVLGFMPGALLLVPLIKELWTNRALAPQRFLFCWLAGYLVYLELIASKPALYTVQAMFPAAAAAAALCLQRDGGLTIPPRMLRLQGWFVAIGMAAIFAGVLIITKTPPNVAVVIGAVAVVVLFTLSAQAARQSLAATWVVTSIIGFALFLGFTFGVFLPHIKMAWPAPRIAEAVAPFKSCVKGPVRVLGFREPSTVFVLGRNSEAGPQVIADQIANKKDGIVVMEDRWHPDITTALSKSGAIMPPRAGCIEAFNVMRGCPLNFSVYVTGTPPLDATCAVPPKFSCTKLPPQPKLGAQRESRCR